MQSFNTTIGVSANATSAGQAVDWDAPAVSGVSLRNGGAAPIQYTQDGAIWLNLPAGMSAAVTVASPATFRLRKTTADGYPVPVSVSWTASGTAPAAPSTNFVVPVKRWGKVESTTAAGITWHATLALPFAFDAFKVRVYGGIATTVPNYKVAVGMTDSTASLITPSGGWSNVLFAGSPTATVPAATSGSGSNVVLGYVESDITYVGSLPRADGSRGSYVMIRGYWPTGSASRVALATSPEIEASGVFYAYQSGDHIATPAGFTDATARGVSQPIELICYTKDVPVKKILFVGDSITEGADDTVSKFGWHYAVASLLNSAAAPVQPINYGFSSQSSTAFILNGKNAMDYCGADIATFFPFSPNDTDKYTSAGEQRQICSIAEFLDYAVRKGVKPVLCTPAPIAGVTAEQEASRRRVAAAIRAAASHTTVLDFDLLWTDYTTSTGGWRAGLGSGVHPSGEGYTQAAAYAAPILRSLL